MKELYELDDLVRMFKLEYANFTEKGNKAAGTRARKALSELANFAKVYRKEIQDKKNNPDPEV